MPPEDDDRVGYGRPPKARRFKPDQSGNPRGRPKGSKNLETLLDRELNERITVREGERTRKTSKGAAVIKSLVAKALNGHVPAITAIREMEVQHAQAHAQAHDRTELSAEERQILDALEQRLARSIAPEPEDAE